MESFLRTMREVISISIAYFSPCSKIFFEPALLTVSLPRQIERHPQVLHLPPPHIWQLAPSVGTPQPLVVTLELRVAADLGDAEVVKLTRWAWERCMLALGFVGREQDGGGVTVGIVRG